MPPSHPVPPPALELSRILHAGYLLRHGGTTLAFDPIFEDPFSRNCHAFPPVRFHLDQVRALRLDAVFLSHHHDDHCSLESLDLLDRDTPIYLYCVVEGLHDLIRALGFRHVHALVLDVPVGVGDVRVTPRRALDAEVDAMFHVEAAGLNVLNVVDAWVDPDTLEALAAYAPWDLVLWPFQTMRELEVLTPSRATPAPRTLPPEWLEQLRRLAPRAVVPSSCQLQLEPWSWYNDVFFPITYRQFGAELRATVPGVQVVRLDPGASVRLDHGGLTRSAPLPWVTCLATESLDYHYDATTTIPSTAEVAAHFSPPSPAQTDARAGLLSTRAARAPRCSWARPRSRTLGGRGGGVCRCTITRGRPRTCTIGCTRSAWSRWRPPVARWAGPPSCRSSSCTPRSRTGSR
jgi:L-ascorbate metabolism protein UlaG (beta-lactamase superfamily)